jgi:cytochrome P450
VVVDDSRAYAVAAGAGGAGEIADDMFSASAIEDPYGCFGHLREVDPVHWNDEYRVWMVTGFEDVAWINGHPKVFSSAIVDTDEDPYPPIKETDRADLRFVRRNIRRRMTHLDAPEHTAVRGALRPFFSPEGTTRWAEVVRAAVVELLDRLEGRSEMDMVADFAAPFPLGVIQQIMGIPEADRSWVQGVAQNLLVGPRVGESRMNEIATAIRQLSDYLEPLLEERLANPGDDLLSEVMAGEKAGVYDRDQAMQNVVFLIVAGHDTTINMICNGVLAFTKYPDQWQRLRNDTDGLIDSAVEEILRYDSPVKSVERIAVQDVELNGKLIRKGERVRWFISSANRDPRRFTDPDTFDIGRRPNGHVAFGRGVHLCLGAPLARLEAQLAFTEFARRFPKLTLKTADLHYTPSADLRSLNELVITW